MTEPSINAVPNRLLGELERMRELAQGELNTEASPKPEQSFSELMAKQLGDVNSAQHNAASLAQLFELGDESVSLVDVMVASQKSRVAFSALVEVRNKMLTAYQEIMNMQV